MQSTQQPAKFPVPFGNLAGAAYKRTIPRLASATPGAASLDQGFPPACFLDPNAGGVPPFGADFNGILYWITSWILWQQSGGLPAFDADQAAAIGGYPAGAALISADGTHFWRSTADNNATNPDAGGANWVVLQPATYAFGNLTGVPNFTLESEFTGSNQSLLNSGYQKLPGGLILQWTRFSAPDGGSYANVTLPITFPFACFGAWGTTEDASKVLAVNTVSPSQVNVQNGGGVTCFLFAVGH